MPFPNNHACVIRDSGDFQEGSIRTDTRKHEGKEYKVRMGKVKGEDTMTDQSFLYPKASWKEDEAKKHCQDHKGSFEPASEEKAEGYRALLNKPWLIQEDTLFEILSLLDSPNMAFWGGDRETEKKRYAIEGDTAIIPISGVIRQKPSF